MAKYLNRPPSERGGIDRAPRGRSPRGARSIPTRERGGRRDILPICPTLTLDIAIIPEYIKVVSVACW